MELGSLEIQIFVSLVVVLGTAFVALVCDFLKGNNEQLRERNIELRVRQDERERMGLFQPLSWLQGLAALARNPQLAESLAGGGAPAKEEGGSRAERRSRQARAEVAAEAGAMTWASKDELEELADRAARLRARHQVAEESAGEPEPAPELPVAEAPPEPEPVTAEVEEAAAVRDELEAVAPPPAEPVSPPPEPVSAPPEPELIQPELVRMKVLPIDVNTAERFGVREELDLDEELERVASAETEAAEAEPAEVAAGEPEEVEEPAVWREAESEVTAAEAEEPAEPLVAEIEEERQEGPLVIPAGLHEASVLTELLENPAPFTGVAVAIGINDYESLKEKLAAAEDSSDSLGALNRMVQSMLRPQDFGCRFLEDEFILLYPGESGSSAQRRLFQVSEKLWDFQLRSLGHLSVMFSWGGLEVGEETLAEAVAAARERMYHTKRGRKAGPAGFSLTRKVVNA